MNFAFNLIRQEQPQFFSAATITIGSPTRSANTGKWITPVTRQVFDAIRQEKLYILTHPHTKEWVKRRMEKILA